MNKAFLCGRLVRDVEVRYSGGDEPTAVARYTLAVDRNGDEADFISCVAFGKTGEFAEKYLRKGQKILVEGEIRTGSYKDKDGDTHYTTDVVVSRHEFCEKKTEADEDEYSKPKTKKKYR